MARRLKATLEAQLGVRVILTRDDDSAVPLDRRTELANNQKADVFVSLHANWSSRPAARGIQIYTLGLAAYGADIGEVGAGRQGVPILGGGTRVIDPVPWDLAQVPFAHESAAVGEVLARHFSERGIQLFAAPAVAAPMRILMGANMPAVLIEMGFLSNSEDEQLLATGDWQARVVDAIVAALVEARRDP
jgi:N-acetylmuramoyl-L-alanine amidase